jgi:hypothetical protein
MTTMAYITIETDTDGGLRTLHESVSCEDLDNQVFSDHLVERLRWAVQDTEPVPREPQKAAAATLIGGIFEALDPRPK